MCLGFEDVKHASIEDCTFMFSSRRMMKYWEQGCADGEVRKDFLGLAVDSRVVVGNRRRLPIFFVYSSPPTLW